MSIKRKKQLGQQIYGRNDMANIEPNKKIYGSLGKTEKWFLSTVEGNPVTMANSRNGSFEKEVTEFNLYGWSKQDGIPSPENPVEIESAGMKWSTGKNLINADEYYSQFKQSDGTYKAKTVTLNDIRISLSEFVGKEITISVKLTVGANTTAVFISYNGSELNHINGSIVASGLTGKSTLTIKPVSNTDYFVISFGSGNDDVIFSELQLELGSVATSYEPYTGGIPKPYGDKVELSVRGKNLFHITKESDCDKAYDNTTKRIILPGEYLIGLSSNNYYIARDAFIDLNTDSISFIYSGNSGYGVGIGINCQKSKTYAFSFETNKGVAYAVFYSEDGKYKARVLISTYNVFAVPDYVEHVVILLTNNDGAVAGDTIWFKNVQIEEAKSITAYEPYRTPQSTAIVTPNGLPGIPVPSNTAGITYTDANGQAWIADDIDLERGKYVQRIGKVDLENLLWKLIGNCFRSEAISDSKVYKWTSEIANIICSHYICKMTSYNMQYNSDGQDNLIGMYNNQIEIKDTRYNNDVDLFKQSLSGVYAYYVLAIPVERDLTSAELAEYTQLYSYKPTTVVKNDSDSHMKITYKATGN